MADVSSAEEKGPADTEFAPAEVKVGDQSKDAESSASEPAAQRQSPTAQQSSAPPQDAYTTDVDGKIFVGGLSFSTTEDGLRFYFEKFGEVESVDLMKDKNTGQPRFVHFPEIKILCADTFSDFFSPSCPSNDRLFPFGIFFISQRFRLRKDEEPPCCRCDSRTRAPGRWKTSRCEEGCAQRQCSRSSREGRNKKGFCWRATD